MLEAEQFEHGSYIEVEGLITIASLKNYFYSLFIEKQTTDSCTMLISDELDFGNLNDCSSISITDWTDCSRNFADQDLFDLHSFAFIDFAWNFGFPLNLMNEIFFDLHFLPFKDWKLVSEEELKAQSNFEIHFNLQVMLTFANFFFFLKLFYQWFLHF